MKTNSRFYLLSLLLAGLISSGCEETGIGDGQVCTQIGCDDGVTVQLSDERPDSVSLTLYLNSETEAFSSIECADAGNMCAIRTDGFTPETITVVLEWDGEEFRQTYTPQYQRFQPNGPNCPPVCKISNVVIDLSELS
jgi:hypothetical protein